MSDTEPNVLLVCTDQERYDLTAPGGPDVETPAADRLAGEGLRCEHAFTPTAICSPARVSMLTGLYPHNHGVLSNPTRQFIPTAHPEDTPTYGDLLSEAGFTPTYAGKWHVEGASPADCGFEQVTGWDHSPDQTLDTEDYERFARERGVDPDAVEVDRRDVPGNPGAVDMPAEATQTAYLAERTIERLAEFADSDERFVHRLDFPGPHAPYVAPREHVERYDPATIEPWPSFEEDFEGKPGIHERHPEYYDCENLDWETWAAAAAHYFAFETHVEEQFDRVLSALDEFGLTEDTVVIRTSDHGDFCGAHRQWGKGAMMYDDLYRVPFFVRWPGVVEAGRVADSFVELQDLMPTVCELCGVEPPETDGQSLVPFFEGEDHREAAVAEYHGEPETLYTQRMVRTDRYKFVFNGPDRNELYDLAADPHELTNLAEDPDYETVRLRLARRLGDWMEETGDDISVHRYRNRCC